MNIQDFPITAALVVANVIISLIAMNNQDVLSKTIMWPYGVKRYNQFYRFITSGFIHADYTHLFFNMFTLFFFGKAVEAYFSMYGLGGNIAYLALYFLGLIVSDLPTYIKHKDNYNYHCLGASGAVSAVVFAAVVFAPWSSIYLFGALKISALVYAVLYIFYCIAMSKKGGDNINHDAHLWGALFGLGFTIALIAAMQPILFTYILEELKNPSLFGRG
ncbi:MAG: rhomboid family intramembrane serine protease [Chitinophagaceae bacterium]|jgi:membrane associated rhomboid family serine protease|nr:rhomboid family intramembrane serine protease [Chitinophagaceae bacterium]MBK7679799.1 rhomboid family intramembrane serine protease [Chitinophagaceae bacterium]MBK8298847.1 rhomboid family intramembrane serine protease [Chitinophagaceae bacterium]MBK9464672.1 rhomboid family intramembrane serine protease [Chitinophagaceae bacterium]MBK9659971.1 rhomboid family intramembrane serine protease [Chitinophagaceae bacterium]